MILKDTLFKILEQKNMDERTSVFRVRWIAENFIYQAHFPNNPITPGVCLIQAAVELFGEVKGENFRLKTLKNVKFMAPVNPVDFTEVEFHLDFSNNNLKAVIKENETVFAKMSLVTE
jgi:3-hydroxyacyl-[acyl-carrier-protein] dehydratase